MIIKALFLRWLHCLFKFHCSWNERDRRGIVSVECYTCGKVFYRRSEA